MESKTLFKTGDVEVQQSSRGAISFGYTDSTAAMFDLYGRIAELEAESKGWEECAKMHAGNQEYYRNLVAGIGELFGEEARTSDDGSKQDSVLVAKVPELVNQLAAQNERVRKIIGGTPKYSSDEDDLEEIESAMDEAWKILNESPAASLAEIQASAVNGFAQEVGVFDPGYDDQEYVEIPRYKVREYIESLRQQQGFTCKRGTILYGTSCLNCDCERAQESHS